MSVRAVAVYTERIRSSLAGLRALESRHPGEVSRVVQLLLADLRSWHPESVAPLGVLGPPTTPICDPRTPP